MRAEIFNQLFNYLKHSYYPLVGTSCLSAELLFVFSWEYHAETDLKCWPFLGFVPGAEVATKWRCESSREQENSGLHQKSNC